MENKIILYHGSHNKFIKFKKEKINNFDNLLTYHRPYKKDGKDIIIPNWFWFSPDMSYVSTYGCFRYTCEISYNKLFWIWIKDEEYNQLNNEFKELFPNREISDIFNFELGADDIINFLKSKGYQGIVQGYKTYNLDPVFYCIFDAKNIKIIKRERIIFSSQQYSSKIYFTGTVKIDNKRFSAFNNLKFDLIRNTIPELKKFWNDFGNSVVKEKFHNHA